jgi:septum formation protein
MSVTPAAQIPRRVLLIGSSSKWRISTLMQHFQRVEATSASDYEDKGGIPHFNEFLTLSPDIDEKAIRRDRPEDLCLAIAEAKMDKILLLLNTPLAAAEDDAVSRELKPMQELFAHAVRMSSSPALPPGDSDNNNNNLEEFWIITGDQVAVYENCVREKPLTREENVAFLQSYRGSSVETVAGTVLVNVLRGNMRRQSKVNHTKTTFRPDLPDDVIERVIERGDSLQCCGGFVVDDIELREFIESVVPSFEAVAGLDMDAVSSLMQEMHP